MRIAMISEHARAGYAAATVQRVRGRHQWDGTARRLESIYSDLSVVVRAEAVA